MSYISKKIKKALSSIDTIAVKLLMLVLFITIIPLVVIANFSTDNIRQNLNDRILEKVNIGLNVFYSNDKEEFKNQKQVTTKFLEKENNNFTKKKLVNFLASNNFDAYILINKNELNKLNNYEIKTLLDKVIDEKTIISSYEIIKQNDFKNIKKLFVSENKLLFDIARIVAIPTNNENVFISIKYLSSKDKIFKNINNINNLNLTIYKIDKLNQNQITKIFSNDNTKSLSNPKNIKQIIQSLALKDKVFIKNKEENILQQNIFLPIKNHQGEVIGSFNINGYEFTNLVEQNIKVISKISIISLLVAIIIAMLFSRTFTIPVLKLVSATKKFAEGDLKHRVNIKGSDELAKLAETFNKMAENLETQNQLKDNFVATLTHDLKVPMLAQNQTIDYLLKQVYGPLSNDQEDVLKLIKSTNNSSLQMVSTLLEVYRYDSGNVRLIKNEFDIVKLSKIAINEVRSLAEEKNMSLVLNTNTPEILVNADEREIKRVFHNLISNAINNGIHRGCIYINIEKIDKNKIYSPIIETDSYTTLKSPINLCNKVKISIKDDGIGIEREDIDRLFKRFSLGKGRKPSGTGLGLYYTSQVVKQHKGQVWAESFEKEGATFLFYLPLDNLKGETI